MHGLHPPATLPALDTTGSHKALVTLVTELAGAVVDCGEGGGDETRDTTAESKNFMFLFFEGYYIRLGIEICVKFLNVVSCCISF